MDAAPMKVSTVLLVEDNRTDSKFIKLCINKLPIPLQIEHSSTSDEALCYIAACCSGKPPSLPDYALPDLILLDLNLPGQGGHAVLRQIRLRPQLKFTPVVIFSTSFYEEDILACYEMGANSYITKPSDFRSFRTALERAVIYWIDTNCSTPQQYSEHCH